MGLDEPENSRFKRLRGNWSQDVASSAVTLTEELVSRLVRNLVLPGVGSFSVGEVVDIRDDTGHWAEAELLAIDPIYPRVFVSYVNWDITCDQWVSNIEEKIAKLHTNTYVNGGLVKIDQRIECLDVDKQWRVAYVIDTNQTQFKVHYTSKHSRFDEWIDRDTNRIRQFQRDVSETKKSRIWTVPKIEIESNEDNSMDFDAFRDTNFVDNMAQSSANDYNSNERQSKHIRKIALESNPYHRYLSKLKKHSLHVFPVEGDGNCLFRSVAHQVYGNSELHNIIRQKCLDYMEIESDFFSSFVEGEAAQFSEYIKVMRMESVWGDDPEIQAICELYGRPAEIWAYDAIEGARRLKTFHEVAASQESHMQPIRLSYYGGGHYDSLIFPEMQSHFSRFSPGTAEDRILTHLKLRKQLMITDDNRSSASSGDNRDDTETFDRIVEISRRSNMQWKEVDLDEALHKSVIAALKQACELSTGAGDDEDMSGIIDRNTSNKSEANEDVIIRNILDVGETQSSIIRSVEQTSAIESVDKNIMENIENDFTEEELLKSVLNESKATSSTLEDEILQQALKQSAQHELDEEDMLKAALLASMTSNSSTNAMNPEYYYEDEDFDLNAAIQESLRNQ